jgi:hypothetical protein
MAYFLVRLYKKRLPATAYGRRTRLDGDRRLPAAVSATPAAPAFGGLFLING